jgi:hypothetical protein
VTVPVSALTGILARIVTCAPRDGLGMDVRTRVTGTAARSMVDACQTVAVSAWMVGEVMIVQDARRATLGATVKGATTTRRVGATDVVGQTGRVSALMGLQGPAVTYVRRAGGAKAARWNAGPTQSVWVMDGVLEMDVAYAHRDLSGRVATSVMRACMGSVVTLPAHALSTGCVLGMGPACVQTDGWATPAMSALQATLGPSARRFAMPRSIAARRECVSATGAVGAWIRTAEQTAAGVEVVFSVQIASMSAGQTRVPTVAGV